MGAVRFVNAKVNIGLSVVRRRPDGYHEIETVFLPVGLYAGTPENPTEFCDILELTPGMMGAGLCFTTQGHNVDCPAAENLVYRAARLYLDNRPDVVPDLVLTIEKHLPEQAGMGGGSADAAFTLLMLAELERDFTGTGPYEEELRDMALALGADCPFFLLNKPAFACGVGERLMPVDLDLADYWMVIVKPPVAVSTKQAFAGITPRPARFDLRQIAALPMADWKTKVHNDFEDSIFPQLPVLAGIKEELYAKGAVYASMTGSGSCLYGIFNSRHTAQQVASSFKSPTTNTQSYLLKL